MTVYYLDTSALVKRYVQEQGSLWMLNVTDPAQKHDFYTAHIAGPEFIAALFRRVRTGSIAVSDAKRVAVNFRSDWQTQYQLVQIHARLIEYAMQLAETQVLRGYDAVHLAAAHELHALREALQLPTLIFVSADVEQIQAAQAEGLFVENPNNYL